MAYDNRRGRSPFSGSRYVSQYVGNNNQTYNMVANNLQRKYDNNLATMDKLSFLAASPDMLPSDLAANEEYVNRIRKFTEDMSKTGDNYHMVGDHIRQLAKEYSLDPILQNARKQKKVADSLIERSKDLSQAQKLKVSRAISKYNETGSMLDEEGKLTSIEGVDFYEDVNIQESVDAFYKNWKETNYPNGLEGASTKDLSEAGNVFLRSGSLNRQLEDEVKLDYFKETGQHYTYDEGSDEGLFKELYGKKVQTYLYPYVKKNDYLKNNNSNGRNNRNGQGSVNTTGIVHHGAGHNTSNLLEGYPSLEEAQNYLDEINGKLGGNLSTSERRVLIMKKNQLENEIRQYKHSMEANPKEGFRKTGFNGILDGLNAAKWLTFASQDKLWGSVFGAPGDVWDAVADTINGYLGYGRNAQKKADEQGVKLDKPIPSWDSFGNQYNILGAIPRLLTDAEKFYEDKEHGSMKQYNKNLNDDDAYHKYLSEIGGSVTPVHSTFTVEGAEEISNMYMPALNSSNLSVNNIDGTKRDTEEFKNVSGKKITGLVSVGGKYFIKVEATPHTLNDKGKKIANPNAGDVWLVEEKGSSTILANMLWDGYDQMLNLNDKNGRYEDTKAFYESAVNPHHMTSTLRNLPVGGAGIPVASSYNNIHRNDYTVNKTQDLTGSDVYNVYNNKGEAYTEDGITRDFNLSSATRLMEGVIQNQERKYTFPLIKNQLEGLKNEGTKIKITSPYDGSTIGWAYSKTKDNVIEYMFENRNGVQPYTTFENLVNASINQMFINGGYNTIWGKDELSHLPGFFNQTFYNTSK